MDTPNNTATIWLAAFAVLHIMHRQAVRISGIPQQSAPSVLVITYQITKDGPSIRISNDEKSQN